jgi:ketosteroid isomerase-like protein
MAAAAGTPTAAGTAKDEADIRRLFDGWAEAVRAKDIDGALRGYAPDLLAFDLINPLRYVGLDDLRSRLADWFLSFAGPIGYENRDLSVAASQDVAFSHSLNHVNGTTTDGQKIDMWWRATVCFRKIDGEWMVTHSHTSEVFLPDRYRRSEPVVRPTTYSATPLLYLTDAVPSCLHAAA